MAFNPETFFFLLRAITGELFFWTEFFRDLCRAELFSLALGCRLS
jgi:hypothetical protein